MFGSVSFMHEVDLTNKTGNDNELCSKKMKPDEMTVSRFGKVADDCSNGEVDVPCIIRRRIKGTSNKLLSEIESFSCSVPSVHSSQWCASESKESTHMNFIWSSRRMNQEQQNSVHRSSNLKEILLQSFAVRRQTLSLAELTGTAERSNRHDHTKYRLKTCRTVPLQ